jgi:Na+-transporting methylmalonyl-CoA/oxaloacetate decarboxylase gamma subunit
MNIYYFRARLMPTALTCIPLFILVHSVILKNYGDTLTPILSILPILSSMGISFALVFLLTQINRVLSKEIFQRFYFKNEINMPTTDYLMWSNNNYEAAIKEKLRLKIHTMYDIELHNPVDETADEESSRKRIMVAVSQIRNNLRENPLLFRHNIEYGFFRNLLGGCVIAIVLSILIVVYANYYANNTLLYLGIILIIGYAIPLLLSKKILSVYGNNYAKILFEQFLSIPKP